MDEAALKNFIFESGKRTYASGDSSIKTKEADGSTTILYKSGNYKLHDNYFGGEPYGGREVVFLEDKPIWMMVYYGLVHEGFPFGEVYAFLMESLLQTSLEAPYRGPARYVKETWKYENALVGELGNFSGTEKIFKDDICVYEASYIGGFVDRA